MYKRQHDTPCNKLDIFAGVEHFGKIVNCSIRIGTTHTLDKGGNDVVVVITFFIILDNALLDTFRSNFQCQVDMSVSTLRGGEAVSYTHLDVYKRQGTYVKQQTCSG